MSALRCTIQVFWSKLFVSSEFLGAFGSLWLLRKDLVRDIEDARRRVLFHRRGDGLVRRRKLVYNF